MRAAGGAHAPPPGRRSPEYFGPVPTPPHAAVAAEAEGGAVDPGQWTPYSPHLYPEAVRAQLYNVPPEGACHGWVVGSKGLIS